MTNEVNANVSTIIYNQLVAELGGLTALSAAVKNAKAEASTIEGRCIQIAADFTDLDEASATLEALVSDVQFNADGIADKIGAEARDKPTKDGKTHKVPPALSNIKSIILFAFEAGIDVLDTEGNPKSMRELRKQRTAALAAEKQLEADAAVAALTGIDRLRFDVMQSLETLARYVASCNDAEVLVSVQSGVQSLYPSAEERKEKANKTAAKRAKSEKSKKGGQGAAEALTAAVAA